MDSGTQDQRAERSPQRQSYPGRSVREDSERDDDDGNEEGGDGDGDDGL